MPLTNQQIEVQRERFESIHGEQLNIEKRNGEYTDMRTTNFFFVWCSAIESVEIELPIENIWQIEGDDVIYIADLEQSIEQQGYKVKP